ncbi:MT-A70 family methyltransferase [Burkholderia sp. IDO3]|uniref:Spo0J and IME4 domain-containing protein n=1 Tax=Burkholderia sp. IDO3 TaxID=1705310 RepID=UPI000BBA7862|nr:MT-A70 family methyltransferase [Burkholderia sp. IDO3]AXK66459.1 S-adenosylmethionine-binding protein [Burkholderia sp. IDO3]PCD59024.1 S-adenosylmethionine-binding protein [Burkholderia sp. IDO3]
MKTIEYTKYQIHSAAALFPPMSDGEFAELMADIGTNGQQMPILVYRNKIVDGRERLRACHKLGIEPVYKDVGKLDVPTSAFIVSQNLHRRHLSDSQRAMIAAKLSNTKKGTNQHTAEAVSQKQAASACNVSVDSLQRASKVLESGHEDLIQSVESGELDVSNAATLITLPREELDDLVQRSAKEMIARAKKERDEARDELRKRKLEQIDKTRKNSQPFDHGVGPFNVIYADPPWDYIPEVQLGYPAMKLDAICDLLRGSKAVSPDAVLFLWVPASLIAEGLKVIEAWGFRYITHAIWHKGESGMGSYFRMAHEVLMFATRGSTAIPEVPTGARPGSVFSYRRGMHSQKPEELYWVIERMYPELPKMELFRRGVSRDGWYSWGNEVQHGPATPLGQQIVDAMAVEPVAGELTEMVEAGDAVNDLEPQAA